MEECEALCDSLGIMINGQMSCIGTIPNLKKKYGEGYSLIIKLKHTDHIDLSFNNIDEFVRKNIPNAILEGNTFIFTDPSTRSFLVKILNTKR